MPAGIFSLDTLIDTIWAALTGGSYNLAEAFQALGAGLWSIMCLWAFANEALDMAMGRGTNLPKLLLRWAVIGAVLAAWPAMAAKLYGVAGDLASPAAGFPDLRDLFTAFMQGHQQMQNADQAAAAGQESLGIAAALAALPTAMMMNQVAALGGFVCLVCFAVVVVSVAGLFMILAMYLVLGPVFIPLGMTDAFSSFFYKWIGVVLAFFLVIPLYGGALCIIFALLGGSVVQFTNLTALPSLEHVFQAVIGPILSVGLILGVNRVATSLTGSYFGQSGSMAFSIGLAATGIGARLGLSAATAGANAPAAATGSTSGAVTAAVGSAPATGGATTAVRS